MRVEAPPSDFKLAIDSVDKLTSTCIDIVVQVYPTNRREIMSTESDSILLKLALNAMPGLGGV